MMVSSVLGCLAGAWACCAVVCGGTTLLSGVTFCAVASAPQASTNAGNNPMKPPHGVMARPHQCLAMADTTGSAGGVFLAASASARSSVAAYSNGASIG